MIQFNLLPDVKLKYVKARQLKRRIMTISTLVIFGSAGTTLLALMFVLGQNKLTANLTNDIKSVKSSIQATPDLDKILTIQNQLNALPGLHDKKPISSRFFEYINKLTPADVKLASFELNAVDHTVTFTGTAPSLEVVNRFSDTLKFAKVSDGDNSETKAFSQVSTTLTRGGISSSFSISAKYEPVLSDATKQPVLTVPDIVSTRSETEKPAQLFENKSEGQ